MEDNITKFKVTNDENLKEAIEKLKLECNKSKTEGLNKTKEKFKRIERLRQLD